MDEAETEAELTALKEVVQNSLEKRGVLGKIRADLRAAVFTVIDAEERKEGVHREDKTLQNLVSSEDGALAAALFVDFLDSLDLKATKSVFEPDINMDNVPSRELISKKLQLPRSAVQETETPLLVSLLKSLRNGTAAASPRNRSPASSPREKSSSPRSKKGSPKPKLSALGTSPKSSLGATSLPPVSPTGRNSAAEHRVRQLDEELRSMVKNDQSGSLKEIAQKTGGPGLSPNNSVLNSSSKSSSSVKEGNQSSLEKSNGADDDDYYYDQDEEFSEHIIEEADEVEDEIEVEVGGESMDSVSFGESSGFLSMSGGGGVLGRSSHDKEDELSMSTSIVADSMDLSVQNSRALDEYDFVEKVEKPGQ